MSVGGRAGGAARRARRTAHGVAAHGRAGRPAGAPGQTVAACDLPADSDSPTAAPRSAGPGGPGWQRRLVAAQAGPPGNAEYMDEEGVFLAVTLANRAGSSPGPMCQAPSGCLCIILLQG